MKRVPKKWQRLRPETIQVLRERDFYDPREDRYGALAPPEKGLSGPCYNSIAYAFKTAKEAASVFDGTKEGFAYPRIGRGTPPMEQLVQELLNLELGAQNSERENFDAILTGSGMSAIMLTVFALGHGGEFISSPYLYGGTYHLFTEFLPKFGISCHMIDDPTDMLKWSGMLDKYPKSRFLFAEDDANPTPIKLNNAGIAEIAHAYGKYYFCDRTIGTPISEQPLIFGPTYGADIVIHSLSKNIGGRSGGLGGAVIGKKPLIDAVREFFPVFGPVMDARVADYMLDGIRNLKQRMLQKRKNTLRIATFLRAHPRVKKVYGPGGDLLAFEIHGSFGDAQRVIERYKLILFAPHLGDIRTLSIHPASTTHAKVAPEERQKLGISDTLIRLSVGLEDPEDIIDDLKQALEP